ncbi:MAG TPA: hypothetical protein VG895_01310 [Patescibacteria group bacterium]|nr:hypothetical protein [Patescibacteria group bacterium]
MSPDQKPEIQKQNNPAKNLLAHVHELYKVGLQKDLALLNLLEQPTPENENTYNQKRLQYDDIQERINTSTNEEKEEALILLIEEQEEITKRHESKMREMSEARITISRIPAK